jgi:hypothetical protein
MKKEIKNIYLYLLKVDPNTEFQCIFCKETLKRKEWSVHRNKHEETAILH